MTAPREDLESPDVERLFGLGWISGVLAVDVAIAGLGAVLCLRYPELLTVPEARGVYNVAMIRLAFFAPLLTAFPRAAIPLGSFQAIFGKLHTVRTLGRLSSRKMPRAHLGEISIGPRLAHVVELGGRGLLEPLP